MKVVAPWRWPKHVAAVNNKYFTTGREGLCGIIWDVLPKSRIVNPSSRSAIVENRPVSQLQSYDTHYNVPCIYCIYRTLINTWFTYGIIYSADMFVRCEWLCAFLRIQLPSYILIYWVGSCLLRCGKFHVQIGPKFCLGTGCPDRVSFVKYTDVGPETLNIALQHPVMQTA